MSKKQEREGNSNWKGGVTFKKCVVCNKEFRSNGVTTHCSKNCYLQSTRRKKEQKFCLNCNKPISFFRGKRELYYGEYVKVKFCSYKCAYNYFKKQTFLKKKKNCEVCRKEYLPKCKNSKYCSWRCKKKGSKGKNLWTTKQKKMHSKKVHETWLKKYEDKDYYVKMHSHSYRQINPRPETCTICKEVKKYMIVHHIDGNRKNNHPSNLKWICQGCHLRIERNKNGRKNSSRRNKGL
jgi:hypothetical protein